MKKTIYIALFIFLGLLLQFLVHALIEIPYLGLLNIDFDRYSLDFSWQELLVIHAVFTIVLIIAGALFGFWQGKYWWNKIYKNRKDKK